jgi:acetoin utilization protein AcuB
MTRRVRALVRPVPAVDPTATLADADAAMRSGGAEAVAVIRLGRLVGLVMADDLVAARPSAATTLSIGEVNGALAQIPIQSIMRRDVATVVPDTSIAEAARLLRDGRGPLAVLAGEAFVGLLGSADLLPELEQRESG